MVEFCYIVTQVTLLVLVYFVVLCVCFHLVLFCFSLFVLFVSLFVVLGWGFLCVVVVVVVYCGTI